jgi:maltose O-acetyltransferase
MTGEVDAAQARIAANSVLSRAWGLRVNTIAASNLVSRRLRARIYRRAGLDVQTEDISPHCFFHTCDIRIGAEAVINYGCYFENVAHVEIGPRAGLAMFVKIITSAHGIGPREARPVDWTPTPVTIGSGCWIGANAVILPGVTIGDGCVVATGAVVTEDCKPDAVYGGVPARLIRDLPPGTP